MIPILRVIQTLKNEINVDDVQSVLDLGCGSYYKHRNEHLYKERDLMTTIFSGKDITGLDLYENDIEWRNQYGPKGNYMVMDIMDFDIDKHYDVIICHHTLEHLTQEEHDVIFNRIENSSYKYSIIGGPVGFSPNHDCEMDTGNEHQKHKIGLDPDYYKQFGYKVWVFDYAFLGLKVK